MCVLAKAQVLCFQSTAAHNFNIFHRPLVESRQLLQPLNSSKAADDSPKAYSSAVQPGQRSQSHKELRAVSVRPTASHGQHSWLVKLYIKRLVFEGSCAEDRCAFCAAAAEDVPSLDPASLHYSVDRAVFVREPLH
jgi:hypothetical protein